jgi:hypothetical protein
MRPLLGLAMASKKLAMVPGKMWLFCNNHATQAIQYLGGYSQLDEAVVGVGNGLEKVGNGVGRHAVVLQAQGLQGGVLVHYRAQCRHSKVIYLKGQEIIIVQVIL